MLQSRLEIPVTVRFENSRLEAALETIAKQAGLRVAFSREVLDSKKRITMDLVDIAAGKALSTILKGTGLQYRVTDRNGVVIESTKTVEADAVGNITGRVLDSASGEGIAGVSVSVQGTKLSVLTVRSGEFTIPDVPVGDQTVAFKLLGYASVTRVVQVEEKKRVLLRVIMKATASMLSGVVTTATGVQRKMEIGNSIASINVDSVMRVAPIMTLTDLLETRVPGLTVQRTSGTPGDPARIRIRGSSSIEQSNEPIVIVDGIRIYGSQSGGLNENLSQGLGGNIHGGGLAKTRTPSPLDQIDPNSIETIDVFKGPSAAAMYGSDAAAGVIVITTKHGRAEPPRWTVTLNRGIEMMPGKYPIGTYRFGHQENPNLFGNTVALCTRTTFDCVTDSIKYSQALNDPRLSIIDRGDNSGASVTTRGGVSILQYSLSASYSKQIGMLRMPDLEVGQFTKVFGVAPFTWMRRPEQYDTWGVTASLSAKSSPKTNVVVSSVVYSSTQQRSSFSEAVKLLATSYVDESRIGTSPILPDLYRRMTSDAQRVQLTAQMLWTPTSWLPLSGTIGLNTNTRIDETLVPTGFIKTVFDSMGKYALGRGSDEIRSFDVNTRVPFPKARITIVTGLTGTIQSVATMNAQADTIPPGFLLPTAFTKGSQSSRTGSTYGWFVEPRLNITSRFFVMPGLRLDNNGLAGSEAGIMGLPKMNFSWITSDESFFPWRQYINLLRLRAAFGASGVQPGPGDRGRTYAVVNETAIGGTVSSAVEAPVVGGKTLTLSGLGNTELRPERSVEIEGGFDTDFWNNRMHIDFTGYRKIKRDAIITSPLGTSVGGGTVKLNIGEVRNTGLEASTTLQVIERKNFSWNTGIMMARNNNVVVRLNKGQSQIAMSEAGTGATAYGKTLVVPGYPLFGRWVRPILAYADVNDNGVLEKTEIRLGDSLVSVGRQEPDYTMTVTSGAILFGRMTINAAFDYVHGVTLVNGLMAGVSSPFGADPDDPIIQQVAYAGVEAGTAYGFVQTVNTLRFNTFSISYNVPTFIARRVGGRSVLLSVRGSNLGVKTNYRGKDPHVGASATGNSLVDQGVIPLPRTLGLSVQIGN